MKIGLLHPGAMGVTVGTALLDSGHEVLWCSDGRSEATRKRAQRFRALDSHDEMMAEAEAIVSVCPPDQALSVARQYSGFGGIFVDANAVAPQTAEVIATELGDNYVDGGIIGPPATQPGTTRVYLAGPRADEVSQWFAKGHLQAITMQQGGVVGASALKMAYAAYTKGASALLLAVNGLAEAQGVRETLESEWELSQPDLSRRSRGAARGTSQKAWRFVGEMEEIAKTFEAVELPAGFHQGAAEIYRRMSQFKELDPQDLEDVLDGLLGSTQKDVT